MKKIILVEDSATMRLFVRMFLRGLREISITEAIDGADGLEKINNDKFDLIITDINMPRVNGLQLIEKVRGAMGLKTPIIILTTKGEEGDVKKGLSLGADNYVTKPIMGPMFTSLIMNYVKAV